MTPSVTESQLFAALRAWLLTVVPSGVEVVQAFQNKTAPPRVRDLTAGGTQPTGYVVMRTLGRQRLGTEASTYRDGGHNGTDTFRDMTVSTEWNAQVDFYSVNGDSADWAWAAAELFRSEPACTYFDGQVSGLAPLYEEGPTQLPLADGEHQWERRMVLGLRFNYAPSVTVEQDFADTLTATTYDVL
jgi:hypothetical protein